MKNITKFAVSFVAVVALLVAANASAAYTHMGLLKMGSTSSQVMELQKTLNSGGFLVSTTGAGSPGMESMYFGAKTKAAVMAFQSAKGLGADGVVGINTGTALAAMTGGSVSYPAGCTSTTGYSSTTGVKCDSTGNTGSTPTGPLAGTDGTIDEVSTISQYGGEEVGESENDVKIAGFEVEASNDGDISISSLKLTFDPTGNDSGDSDHLDDYVESVSVWMGSTKVASADADDFNENSDDTYSKTVTLSGAIVRSDDTEKFYISVDAPSNFDSGDIDGTVDFSVGVESIRYVDGSGVTSTYSASSFSGGGADGVIGWDSTGDGISFNAVGFSDAADTELKVSKASDSPDAGTVIIDADDNTDDVSLLKGEIEIEGTSDVVIDELPVTLTTVGAADLDLVTGSVTLIIDGEEYTESVSTSSVLTATITFDNLDLTIEAGDTIEFEVTADINDIDAGNFDEGDTLTAEVTATNNDYIDAENEEGDQLTDDTEKTGTASGDAQEFRTEGISVTLVSTDAEVSADGTNTYNDTGTFTIKYKVTAVGETVYVSEGPAPTISTSITDTTLAGAATSTLYRLDIGGTATVANVTDIITYTTTDGAEDASNGVQLEDGESATFTLTVARTNDNTGDGGLMRVFLQAVGWNTDDGTTFNVYDFDLEDYKTDPIAVN